MYLGDLKNEALSLIYLGETMLVADNPVFKAFQVPLTGDPTPCNPSFLLSPTFDP